MTLRTHRRNARRYAVHSITPDGRETYLPQLTEREAIRWVQSIRRRTGDMAWYEAE